MSETEDQAPPQRRLNPFAGGASPVIAQEPPRESDDANLARLQELAKKGEKVEGLETELVAVRRDLAIARTGIDSDSPLGRVFLKGYEGDLADVEAVKAAATELGVPMKRWEIPE